MVALFVGLTQAVFAQLNSCSASRTAAPQKLLSFLVPYMTLAALGSPLFGRIEACSSRKLYSESATGVLLQLTRDPCDSCCGRLQESASSALRRHSCGL